MPSCDLHETIRRNPGRRAPEDWPIAEELPDLRAAGVTEQSQIRINPQGDIEMLQGWQLGRLLAVCSATTKAASSELTGLDWS